MKRLFSIAAASVGLFCSVAAADNNGGHGGCRSESEACAVVGEWRFSLGIGAGVHSNPLHGGDEIPIVLLPGWSYYGERFFLDNFTLGYTLLDRPNQSLSLLTTPGLDHIYFEEWGIGNLGFGVSPTGGGTSTGSPAYSADEPAEPDSSDGADPGNDADSERLFIELDQLHDRRVAMLAGLDYSARFGGLTIQFQALTDAMDVHQGDEARLAIGHTFRFPKNAVNITGGALWQSRELLDYYYGLEQDEIPAGVPVYRPSSGIAPFIQLNWRRKLSDTWSWRTTFKYRKLDGEVADSPIVETDDVFILFTGGIYHF